jgi:hypothetical protein
MRTTKTSYFFTIESGRENAFFVHNTKVLFEHILLLFGCSHGCYVLFEHICTCMYRSRFCISTPAIRTGTDIVGQLKQISD